MQGESPFVDISRLLQPSSIAVVGASDRSGNLGGVAVELLAAYGYPGAIWPVHPQETQVRGIECYPDLASLPHPADVAILAVSAARAVDMIAECGAADIRMAVIWSGGFSETDDQGAELQAALVEACRGNEVAVLGPNSLGIIESRLPVTMTFASFLRERVEIWEGNISMVSQSGGLATMAQSMSGQAGFGFRYMISSGNEAVLTMADFIHGLVEDPHTEVIAAYIEGVTVGDKLLMALGEAQTAGKPVVALKAGATSLSAAAASAHTGALVGENRVWRAIFDEFGVIQVDSLEALVDVVLHLSGNGATALPDGDGVAIVTFGGGMGVLAADQTVGVGLEATRFHPDTRARLRELVPPVGSVDNPVDLTPQTYIDPAWLPKLPEALDVVAADPGVDSVLIEAGPMATGGLEVAKILIDYRERCNKPVLIVWPLAPAGVPELFGDEHVHVFGESQRALRVLGRLVARTYHGGPTSVEPDEVEWSSLRAGADDPEVISEDVCTRLLASAGLRTAQGGLVTSVEEAVEVAHELGFPVVMKGISPDVQHRARVGLLAINVGDERQVRRQMEELMQRADDLQVDLTGVYLQEQVHHGVEALVSAFRDETFGSIVCVGFGGISSDMIRDTTLRRAPVDVDNALDAIDRLRILPDLLEKEEARHLAEFVARFSQMAAAAPWRRFVIEVNPVLVTAGGAVAVDSLAVIEEV